MNRIILRISITPTFWLLPFTWKNTYHAKIHNHPKLIPYTGYRVIFLCFNSEFAILPKGASWNPDATHL